MRRNAGYRREPDVNARQRTNWAGNIAFGAPDFYRPAGVPELQAVVAQARRIRVLATGHAFNDMADSPGAQVSLAALPHISVAGATATATHGSGAANQNLAAAVAGLTLVTADGDLVELRRS